MPESAEFDLIADLSDDGAQQKEVYARYGLAAYQAQVFDHGLVNLLAFATRVESDIPVERIDELWDKYFRKTSGQLVSNAESENRLGAADIDLCRNAVSERNRLVHHFFRDHAEDFLAVRGRQRMVDDADEIRDLLLSADQACDRVLKRLLARAGITEAHIESQYQQLRDSIVN